MGVTLGVVALSAVVLQCVALPLAPRLYAVFSPVHALCCAALLASYHPLLGAIRQAFATLHGNRRPFTQQEVWGDTRVQTALAGPALSPSFTPTLYALLLCVAADLCDGLRVGVGTDASAALFFLASCEALTAGVAAGLYYATRGLGAPPSLTLGVACFTCFSLAAYQIQALSPPHPQPLDGWYGAAFTGALACRTFACSALAAQACAGVCGALFPSRERALTRQQLDLSRWGAQAIGALLLLTPPAVRSLFSAAAGGGALAFGCARGGMAALTLSAWLSFFPPDEVAGGYDESGPYGGYASIEAMKGARRAAREAAARRRSEQPPPLMLESPRRAGGVQGLRWHDLALCRDPDGDEAHDFWEAISGGRFRRCSFASAT